MVLIRDTFISMPVFWEATSNQSSSNNVLSLFPVFIFYNPASFFLYLFAHSLSFECHSTAIALLPPLVKTGKAHIN